MNPGFKLLSSVVQTFLFTIIFSNIVFAETIIVRSDRNSFPATYMTDMGWQGMDIDVIKEIFLRVKLDYQIVDRPFKRSLREMKSGTTHLIPNLTKNEERSAYIYWLGPIRITSIGLVVLKKDQHLPIKSCDDLIVVAHQKKKQFGYVRGASYSEYFDNRIKNEPALKKALYLTAGAKQNLKMLQGGRLIGYFHDDFEIQYRFLDKTQNRDKLFDGVALHSYRIENSMGGAYIGISKKIDKNLYQRIVMAFRSMKNDGTFDKIHFTWIGEKPAF